MITSIVKIYDYKVRKALITSFRKIVNNVHLKIKNVKICKILMYANAILIYLDSFCFSLYSILFSKGVAKRKRKIFLRNLFYMQIAIILYIYCDTA